MNFSEALSLLARGKKVRCVHWLEGSFITLKDDKFWWRNDRVSYPTMQRDFWERGVSHFNLPQYIDKEWEEFVDPKVAELTALIKNLEGQLEAAKRELKTLSD